MKIYSSSNYDFSDGPPTPPQMMGMAGRIIDMLAPMFMPMIKEMSEGTQVYMTTEGDKCSSPPPADQMMQCTEAMQVACKNVSKVTWQQDQANPMTLLNFAGCSRGHCLHVHEPKPDGYEHVHASPGNLWHAARAQRHGRLPVGLWQHADGSNAKHGDGNGTTVNSHNPKFHS